MGGGDASSLHWEGPLGQVVTEIFKRSDEQLWIGLDSKEAQAMEEARCEVTTSLSHFLLNYKETTRKRTGEAGLGGTPRPPQPLTLPGRTSWITNAPFVVKTKGRRRVKPGG